MLLCADWGASGGLVAGGLGFHDTKLYSMPASMKLQPKEEIMLERAVAPAAE